MSLANGVVPRLAQAGDISRLVSGERVLAGWPPAGTTVVPLGFPHPWVIVYGEPSAGVDGDWFVTTLSNLAVSINATLAEVLARVGGIFTGPVALYAGTVGNWPVIYEVGSINAMRWLRSTIRGTLGTVEQFQHKMDWGLPGNDPTLTEAEGLAFAELVAQKWALRFGQAFGINTFVGNEVKYTEVGVAQFTQTEGTAADGSGGNLTQDFDTAWFPYGTGTLPTGTGGMTLPYEVACAVTLQTEKRGPSGRGRFYLPPFGTSKMAAGGKFIDTVQTDLLTALAGFFLDVEAASPHVPVVVSRRRIVLNEVTSLNIGIVPDAQRRRRNAQLEARVSYVL